MYSHQAFKQKSILFDFGARFSFEQALQDTSVVVDPKDRSITFPNEEQLKKLDEKVRDCASKLLSCLKEESLPVTQERIKKILGDTVQEAAPLSFQAV